MTLPCSDALSGCIWNGGRISTPLRKELDWIHEKFLKVSALILSYKPKKFPKVQICHLQKIKETIQYYIHNVLIQDWDVLWNSFILLPRML